MADNKRQYKTAIFLLGGGLVNDAGIWRTTNYDEGDKFGVSGDSAIVAAALLQADNPEWLFIASGGKGQFKDTAGVPDISTVIKNELIKLGVPPLNIVEENNSQNTYQQLRNAQTIYEERNLEKLLIIGNQHTLPRLQAMIEFKAELALLKDALGASRLKLLSAEDILLKRNPEIWKEIIKTAYSSEAMKKRIALEQQGARQVKDGTYKFK